ncbi:MAG: hypothetical protein JSV81_14190 [Anaerolineales bacterium]|nr:MAG: hypothetical protein JSV81_14190 [Anaerolineales bacterium]
MLASNTSRPSTNLIRSHSIKIYAGLVAALVTIYAAFTFLPDNYIVPVLGTPTVWHEIVVLAGLGLAGLWLSQRAGFPEVWADHVSNRQRFLLPAIVGLVLGTILVLFNALALKLPAGFHVPFPASVFYYAYASIESEILFRLFPIPLFVWLISGVTLRNRWQGPIFWGVAAVLSLLEPLMQITGLQQMGLLSSMHPIIIGLMITLVYSTNLALAYYFRKSGFLAPLAMRFAFYLAWHIAIPILG